MKAWRWGFSDNFLNMVEKGIAIPPQNTCSRREASGPLGSCSRLSTVWSTELPLFFPARLGWIKVVKTALPKNLLSYPVCARTAMRRNCMCQGRGERHCLSLLTCKKHCFPDRSDNSLITPLSQLLCFSAPSLLQTFSSCCDLNCFTERWSFICWWSFSRLPIHVGAFLSKQLCWTHIIPFFR